MGRGLRLFSDQVTMIETNEIAFLLVEDQAHDAELACCPASA